MNVPASAPAERPHHLRRVLGSGDTAALIVGVMIGSGIFATPPLVAGHLPSTGAMLAVWALGGVLALCGALCYAELSGMFPETGGAYIFLREGYGRLPSFVFGWSQLLVTYPASIAAVSVVFIAYFARLVPIPESLRPAAAAFMCLTLAGLNILGVRLGAWSLRIFTGAKVLALVAIFAVAFAARRGSWSNLTPVWGAPNGSWAVALALSLVAVIWTYDGWSDGPTLAGEVRDKGRDVARALLIGTLGVAAIYLAVNLAYVFVLGVGGVSRSDAVAVDTAERVFGEAGRIFVTLLVLVSTLGSVLAMIIAASRVFFAVGRDGLFLERVGRVHPRFQTPAWALVAVGVVSAAYSLFATFEQIIRYFVFVATLWFVFIIGSVILHRFRRPQHPRPFRVPLYPLPPLVYLVVALGLLFQLARDAPRDAVIGLAVLVLSVPVYYVWERGRRRRA
jgi:APA family basic amino acid/polyamine antiporter